MEPTLCHNLPQEPPKSLSAPGWRRKWPSDSCFHVFFVSLNFRRLFEASSAPCCTRFCIVFAQFSSLALSAVFLYFARAPKGAHAESTGGADTFGMLLKVRSRTGAATMKAKFKEKVER